MDKQETKRVIKLKCPICKKETRWDTPPRGTFCSERCRLADLGNWASESYSIPSMEDASQALEEKNKTQE